MASPRNSKLSPPLGTAELAAFGAVLRDTLIVCLVESDCVWRFAQPRSPAVQDSEAELGEGVWGGEGTVAPQSTWQTHGIWD